MCVEANSIRIHTHCEFCIASVPHHLSDCSYFTGITLMASCLGTFKTKEVLKSWNERVCHSLGIQRAEEAVSVLQTVDVSSVEAHWGLTGSLRMASLSTGIERFPWGYFTERPLVRPSNNIQSCCYFGCSYWLVILIFPLKISSPVPGVYTGKSRTPAMIRQAHPSPNQPTHSFPIAVSLRNKNKACFFRAGLWSANSHLWVQVRNYPICCSGFFLLLSLNML